MKNLLVCLGLLGSVALVFGQYEPVVLFEAVGDTQNQQLGLYTLVPVGDVNGDGYDDILANAYLDGSSFGYSREWRIYYGSSDGVDCHVGFARVDSLARHWVVNYEGSFDDMDGDNYLDIFATFLGESGYLRALYLGGSQFDTVTDWTSPWQVYGGGDIVGDYNGDGYADYVTYQANVGRIWFHRGGPEPDSLPSWSFRRSEDGCYGIHNGGFGDVNGDGYDDFLRYGCAASYPDSNSVDLFLGGPQADSLPDVTWKWPYDRGNWWKIVPDLNGDGYDDIFGTPSCLGEEYYPCLCFGGSSPDFEGDLVLWPASSNPAYAWQSGVGDINGDGYNDLALSWEDGGPGGFGEVVIYLGGRWMDGQPDIHLRGEPSGTYLHSGYRTVSAGDFNGDGISDWVYSSRHGSVQNAYGRITVVSGDTSLHVSVPSGHGPLLPESIKLQPPYPNPFNPEVVIPIEVSVPQMEVQVQVVNTLGQRVYVFPMQHLSAGSHQLRWEGRTSSGRLASSGRYFVRLMSSEGVQVQPMVLQR